MKVVKFEDQRDSAAMLAVKSSAGVAPEVNLRISLHAGKEVPGFEIQDIHDQKSKTWVSVAQQKELMFPLFFFKKKVFKTGCETISRQHRKEGRSNTSTGLEQIT